MFLAAVRGALFADVSLFVAFEASLSFLGLDSGAVLAGAAWFVEALGECLVDKVDSCSAFKLGAHEFDVKGGVVGGGHCCGILVGGIVGIFPLFM